MSTVWNTENPPQDGSLFVALGRVFVTDKHGGYSQPFCSLVCYETLGDYEGWSDEHGMAIAHSPDEIVRIEYWLPCPESEASE